MLPLIPFLGFPEGFHDFLAEIRETIELDVLMSTALDLLDQVQAYQRLIIAVPRVHAADRPNHVRGRRLHIIRNLRGIASAWANLEQIICDFFPNATSSQ